MTTVDDLPRCPFEHVDGLGAEPQLQTLLHDHPGTPVRLRYGKGAAWIIARYEDVKLVTNDPRFSRAALAGMDFPRITPQPIAPPGAIMLQDMPGLRPMRTALGRAFAPGQLERVREQVREIVDGLLDAVLARNGPVDLISAFAEPLPTRVISQVLDIPAHDRERIRRLSGAVKTTDVADAGTAGHAQEELREYVVSLVARRRRTPGEDLVSTLANDSDLTGDAAVSLVISLVLTGHENVKNEIGDIAYLLLTDQKLMSRAKTDFGDVFEELLRYIPFRRGVGTPRVALEDVRVGKHLIRAGDVVHVSYVAANRDPEKFSDPDEIVLDRPRVPNMTFGWGLHACPAEPLARMEIEMAVRALLTRLPTIALAIDPADVDWESGSVNRLPRQLPVNW